MHVHVAVARRRVHHRHRGDLLQRLLEPLAAARDHQVDEALRGRQLGQLRAVAAVEQLDRARRGGPPPRPPRAPAPRAPRSSAPRSSSPAARSRCRSSGTARRSRRSRSAAPRRPPRRRRAAPAPCCSSRPLASVRSSITSPTGSGSAGDLAHPVGHRRDPLLVEGEAVAQRRRRGPRRARRRGRRRSPRGSRRLRSPSSSASRASAAFLVSRVAVASSREARFADAQTSATVLVAVAIGEGRVATDLGARARSLTRTNGPPEHSRSVLSR